MEKKFTFTLSNRYRTIIDIVINILLIISISIKSEFLFLSEIIWYIAHIGEFLRMCATKKKKTLHRFNFHPKWELTPKVFFFIHPRDSTEWNGTIVVFLTMPFSTSESRRFVTIRDVAIQFATIRDVFRVFCCERRDSSRFVTKCREVSWFQNSWRFATNLFATNRDESRHKSLKTSWIITIQFATSRIVAMHREF
jgi:hypothetical protein